MQDLSDKSVPNTVFKIRAHGKWCDLSTEQIFQGKRVILFALPGAFTPTCSTAHLPRYEELAPVFFRHDIDDIYCLSVNDVYVMEAWAKEQHLRHVKILPDGNGDFTRAMGMLVDKRDLGFGERSWRYSMLVEDGIVQKMYIEPEEPGDPYRVSDADTMLKHVAPEAEMQRKAFLFTKAGCPYCEEARRLLDEKGFRFKEMGLGTDGLDASALQALTGQSTTPQVYVEGRHLGGLDALRHFLLESE